MPMKNYYLIFYDFSAEQITRFNFISLER